MVLAILQHPSQNLARHIGQGDGGPVAGFWTHSTKRMSDSSPSIIDMPGAAYARTFQHRFHGLRLQGNSFVDLEHLQVGACELDHL